MVLLQYCNEQEKYPISFGTVNPNIVQIIGDFPIKTAGFTLSREGKKDNWDYLGYTTVYSEVEGGAQFSNDGSVYIPPEPQPEPEPYVPTYEETLSSKISELSSICNVMIESGLEINGQHYSYKYDDQVNLDKIVNIVKVTGLPLGYHADGQSCTEHSAEELINIYMQLAMNQYSQQTYFNQTKQYLLSLEESDANKEYVTNYTYGTPLEEEYLDNYNYMMKLYQNQVEALAGTSFNGTNQMGDE